jgi:hypothetical protein
MKRDALPMLPPSPLSAVLDGSPLSGRYIGRMGLVDWDCLGGEHARPWWWRMLHHKRWQYVGIGSEEVFVGVAIVDLGWCCTAFAYVFDRVRGEVVANWRQDGLPGLQGGVSNELIVGANAWFRGARARLSLQHGDGDVLTLSVRTPAVKVQAELSLAAAPLLLALGRVDGGVAHATQKSSALPVCGWLNVRGRRFDLDQSLASVDCSNGLLARDTDWRWASAHGPGLGFNLQQGYFGSNENALWLDGQVIPLGAARFDFDARQPMVPWKISTDDGLLDLVFTPEGARQEDRNLLIAASHYVQPVGTFSGTVRASQDAPVRQVSRLLGVTEDHRSRW